MPKNVKNAIYNCEYGYLSVSAEPPSRWLSANAFGLRSRGPGFESWLGYGCLVAFFMCYRDGSSRLDTIV